MYLNYLSIFVMAHKTKSDFDVSLLGAGNFKCPLMEELKTIDNYFAFQQRTDFRGWTAVHFVIDSE